MKKIRFAYGKNRGMHVRACRMCMGFCAFFSHFRKTPAPHRCLRQTGRFRPGGSVGAFRLLFLSATSGKPL